MCLYDHDSHASCFAWDLTPQPSHRAQVQCTRLTIQLLNAVARLPNLADLNLAQFDLAAAARCETVLPWPLLAQLASLRSLTALDLSHVMIQEQQACVAGYILMYLLQQWRRLYMDCFPCISNSVYK